jgi:hypothetical protein
MGNTDSTGVLNEDVVKRRAIAKMDSEMRSKMNRGVNYNSMQPEDARFVCLVIAFVFIELRLYFLDLFFRLFGCLFLLVQAAVSPHLTTSAHSDPWRDHDRQDIPLEAPTGCALMGLERLFHGGGCFMGEAVSFAHSRASVH